MSLDYVNDRIRNHYRENRYLAEKEAYSYRLDQQATAEYRRTAAKSDYCKNIFRWEKSRCDSDAMRFSADMVELFSLSGDLTSKEVNGLCRIRAKYLGLDPSYAEYPGTMKLETYLEARQRKQKETRSQVCSLGNRLAKTMTRKEAFRYAWELVSIGEVSLKVAGVTFGNRQEALKRLARYSPAEIRTFLVPEPENQYDPQAVAVMVGVQGGLALYKLGYVSKEQTGTAQALIRNVPRLELVGGDIWGARVNVSL